MKTILVVDDEYAVVEALAALLEDEGYNVATAANGEEALAVLAGGLSPDLILLDVMMPRMDGRALLGALRRDPIRRAVPLIVMSAALSPLSPAELGDAVFLPKPFDLRRLLAAIEARLDHHGS
jgi:CheY-like chemotaxis protein